MNVRRIKSSGSKTKGLVARGKGSDFKQLQRIQKLLKWTIIQRKKLGLSDEFLAKGAKFVADHLAKNEEPRNSEQKLLQEMWNVADDDTKKHIALVLVKLVQA